jgi:hypothetical protein
MLSYCLALENSKLRSRLSEGTQLGMYTFETAQPDRSRAVLVRSDLHLDSALVGRRASIDVLVITACMPGMLFGVVMAQPACTGA